jgi:hypothetical protein
VALVVESVNGVTQRYDVIDQVVITGYMLSQPVGYQYYRFDLAVGQPAFPVKVEIAGSFEITLFLLHDNLPRFYQYYAPAGPGRQVASNCAPVRTVFVQEIANIR